MVRTQEKPVHLIFKDKEIIGFFTRDDESGENIVYVSSKASLEEISEMINKSENKL